MELLQLKYFKDAAELENFSKTAEKNMVPQPSISHAIKKLESELGVQLFDRSGGKIFLNENGRYFYRKASDILNTLSESKIHFSNINNSVLKIYIQAGDFFISSLATDFNILYNKIHIIYSTVDEVLHSEKPPYDFTFTHPINDMSGFHYDVLLRDEIVLLVSKEHYLSQYDEIDVTMLKDENFVGMYDTIPLRVVTDKLLIERIGYVPNYVFKSHENFAIIHLISQNKGIGLMPLNYYSMYPSDKIKIVHLKDSIYSELVIAWSKDKLLSPTEKSFLDFSKQWFHNIKNADL